MESAASIESELHPVKRLQNTPGLNQFELPMLQQQAPPHRLSDPWASPQFGYLLPCPIIFIAVCYRLNKNAG